MIDCNDSCNEILSNKICTTFCKAVVKVHPEDDIDQNTLQQNTNLNTLQNTLQQNNKNRTTLEFKISDQYSNYKINDTVTCFINNLSNQFASYMKHSTLKNIFTISAIVIGCVSGLLICIFIIGLLSSIIQWMGMDNNLDKNSSVKFIKLKSTVNN
ncbi:hypothetical protein ABK040_011301 [Willaertia magna]